MSGVYEDEDESGDEDGKEKEMPELGHGGAGTELVPRMIEAMAGKKVVVHPQVMSIQQYGPGPHLWV